MSDPGAVTDWPEGVGRHVLAQTDSTNAEALRLAPSLSGPAWIMAHRQTAGRGRRGRAWADPAGNLAASLVMRPPGEPADAALRSFVAALALHDTLSEIAGPTARLALKWPNDVLLNGGKVAGILLESAGNAPLTLVIGIGVNLIHAPAPGAVEPGALPPVSLAEQTGQHFTPEAFLDRLAPAFHRREAQLVAEGFGPVRAAWLARAARLGDQITARVGNAARHGRFAGIDQTGALILETASGREAIPAADVFFAES